MLPGYSTCRSIRNSGQRSSVKHYGTINTGLFNDLEATNQTFKSGQRRTTDERFSTAVKRLEFNSSDEMTERRFATFLRNNKNRMLS